MRMETIGLYIHVPFCLQKCPYCDFYSAPPRDEAALDRYTAGMLAAIDRWAERVDAQADSLYFGGGTPSLLGGRRLAALLERADRRFRLFSAEKPEVTLEANPADDLADTLERFAAAGGNRLSLGMQTAVAGELAALGRRHTDADVARTVQDARRAGVERLSLDLMLGIPGQTADSLRGSVRRLAELGADHASAYLLKLEPDTPFGKCPPPVADEDEAAELYELAMAELEGYGYRQYEISNLAKPGCEGRHNLKYWDSRPYLGLGPASSSCLGGRRFSFSRDTAAFLAGGEPEEEPVGEFPVGGEEEYALLRLRLTEGLMEEGFSRRFGRPIPALWRRRAAQLPKELVTADDRGIRFSRRGFLLSNPLIGKILCG